MDEEEQEAHRFILRNHLRLILQINPILKNHVSSALFINYRAHALHGGYFNNIDYDDMNTARINGARNIARIKMHIEKYKPNNTIFYKWRFNLVVGELQYINGCMFKNGNPPHFADFETKNDGSDDDTDDVRTDEEKYYDQRKRMLFHFSEAITERTHWREFPPVIRRLKKMKDIKERARSQFYYVMNEIRTKNMNYKECIRIKPHIKKYSFLTYIRIITAHNAI